MRRLYQITRQLLNTIFMGLIPPAACRFTPTCSVYCAQALHRFGFFQGSAKCLGRLLRCHPFGRGGHDPVK